MQAISFVHFSKQAPIRNRNAVLRPKTLTDYSQKPDLFFGSTNAEAPGQDATESLANDSGDERAEAMLTDLLEFCEPETLQAEMEYLIKSLIRAQERHQQAEALLRDGLGGSDNPELRAFTDEDRALLYCAKKKLAKLNGQNDVEK